jgi:hypothetical protein
MSSWLDLTFMCLTYRISLVFCFSFFLLNSYSQDSTSNSKKELRDDIIEQTKEGGKLDFFTPIKGHEYDGVEIKPKVYTTKRGVALMKWGSLTREMGVETLEDAYSIFAEFKKREINSLEKEYIKLGFNKEL